MCRKKDFGKQFSVSGTLYHQMMEFLNHCFDICWLFIYNSADFHIVLKTSLDRGFQKLLDLLAESYKTNLQSGDPNSRYMYSVITCISINNEGSITVTFGFSVKRAVW